MTVGAPATATLRGAIVGFGEIALGHLEGIDATPALRVEAVVDPLPGRRAAARQRIPHVTTFADVRDLPGGLDFVDICAPPSSHLELVTYGLEHELAVLCEKPLVTTAAEVAALARRVVASPRALLFPCHNYRYAPSIRRLAAAAAQLRPANEPVTGCFRILRTGHACGTASWHPDWRRDATVSGGGVIQDHGPHCFYIAEDIVGAPVTRVRCRLETPSNDGTGVETSATVTSEFGDGSVVEMEFDWTAAARRTVYAFESRHGRVALADDRLDVHKDGAVQSSTVHSGFDDPRHASWFAAVMSDFAAAARTRRQPPGLLESAFRTVRAIDACYTSAREGGTWVRV